MGGFRDLVGGLYDRPAWEGVQGQRPPRPMPRQMRPPAQRANDPRLAQSERDRALRQFDRSNAANVDTYQRQAFDQRNQAAEAASMAAESTGLPAIRRAGSDLTRWGAYTAGTEQGNDDLASGALNLGAGSLGVLGMAGMVPRAPMRGALRPPVTAPEVAPPRITRPPTEIAPNGMPIAPPRPFRNSLRGGSSDLMDAAGMMAPPRTARPPAQAPDAGGGRGGQDLSDFDTDQVWTRAVKGGVDPFEVQPAPGNTMGPGLYFGSDDIVGRAARRIGDDAAVHGAYIRNGKTASYQQWRQAYERAEKGPFGARSAAETERRAVADLERQGYIGVYRRHNHDGSAEINVFRRENVVGVPQESPAPAAPDVGNAGARQPRRVVDIVTPRGETHETIVNPSEADILRLTRPRQITGSAVERGVPASSARGVRYIKDPEGNIYVGNSYDVTHHDLVTRHGLPNRGLLDGGKIVRREDGTLELQNNDGAMPLPRDWLNGRASAAPDVGNAGGGIALRGFHGSKVSGLTELRPGERGPMGAATYLSPNGGVAGRYGENVYEAELENVFHGLGSSAFADSRINPYAIWREQTARLVDAAEPSQRAALAEIASKMDPADGYPFFRRVANFLGSDEAAQALFRRAGFSGISGHVDGPEIAMFGNVRTSNAPARGNAGPEIDALEGPFFHGTSVHGFEVPSPRNQSGGTPAIYLAENERFARQFADIEGEGTGRVLQFSLRRDDIARMDNPEHFERVAQALSQRLGWEMDVARQQLRQRVQNGRLDWAYRQGNQAVRDAGFPAVALNDAYGERSIAVYNKDSLLRPNENADMVRPQLLPPEARGAEVIRAEFPKVSEAERQRFIQQVKNALLDAPARQARIAQDYHRRGLLPLPIGTRMRGSGLRGEPTPDGWVISDYYVSPHNPQEYGYVVSRGEESFRLAVSNQGGLTSNRPDVVLGWQALLGPDGAAAMRAQWASERSARLAERQAANEARRAATPLNDNISAADKQEWDLLYPSENSTPNAPARGNAGVEPVWIEQNTPLYRGAGPDDQFVARETPGWEQDGIGISFDRHPRIASAYANGRAPLDGSGATVYRAYSGERLKLVPFQAWNERITALRSSGLSARDAAKQAQSEFASDGFQGIGYAAAASGEGEVRLWNNAAATLRQNLQFNPSREALSEIDRMDRAQISARTAPNAPARSNARPQK